MNTQLDFPFEMREVDPEEVNKLMRHCKGGDSRYVRVGPQGYFLPLAYREHAAAIYGLSARASDVFVCSFPRSGTTWTQELVWMVANDLDYATSDAVPLTKRYLFLEWSMLVGPMKDTFEKEIKGSESKLQQLDRLLESGAEQLARMTERRFVKTHLPLSLLPPGLRQAKVVYVARDPRDVAVSYYHLTRTLRTRQFHGDFKTFWQLFLQDLLQWAPYFEHLKEAWKSRHDPNMLFLFYEDLIKDLPAAVRRVASFFGKQFSDEQLARLCDHLSIDSFRNNKSVNFDAMKELGMMSADTDGFVRKGKSGGWRDYFDDEMTAQAEQWIAHNLRDTDLRFPHL